MKKLFISQPMNGKTNEEIETVRERAIASATDMLGEPVEVIDSFFKDAPHDARPLWFLGKSLELLATADRETSGTCRGVQKCNGEHVWHAGG